MGKVKTIGQTVCSSWSDTEQMRSLTSLIAGGDRNHHHPFATVAKIILLLIKMIWHKICHICGV
jgi:hypothetical protein